MHRWGIAFNKILFAAYHLKVSTRNAVILDGNRILLIGLFYFSIYT